jgi:putative peptidoglycan lipid II flippase
MAVEAVASQRTLIRSTVIVFLGFTIARVISLVQTVLITEVFGIGADWDRFVAANQLPETIVLILGGVTLTTALMPFFSGLLARDERAHAWRLASRALNTVFLASCLVSLIAFIFASALMQSVVAPGFSPEGIAESAALMRLLLIATLIFSISGATMGLLQSHNRFVAPALAPIMYDVGIFFGAGFLVQPFGVYGIAYGTLIGAALHFAIQVPALIRVGARWVPELGWNDPDVRRVFMLMLPRILDVGVFTFTFTMAINFSSRLGEGAVSAFSWGWRLMQIPQTLIGSAMAVVIFPTLAALSALNDVDGKRNAMVGALKFILIGTIPSAIGLLLVGRPTLSLLEGGAFDAEATNLVYVALRGFALGIIIHSILEVAARSFFADKDTWTPLLITSSGAVINLAFAWVFSGLASGAPDPRGVEAITWGNTLGVTFEVIMLLLILRRRWDGIQENALAMTTVKTVAASLVMALAMVIFDALWASLGLLGQGRLLTIVQVVIQVGIGVVAFGLAAWLLGLTEFKTILTRVLSFRDKHSKVEVAPT